MIDNHWLDITGADGTFTAYLALPTAPRAGVVVIQEIFGVNRHIQSVCDRLAEEGYAALAPDLFWRVEPGYNHGYEPDDIAQGREVMQQIPPERAIADVGAAIQALASHEALAERRIGVVGFCWGGLLAFLSATRLQPACVAAYYGGGTINYLTETPAIQCPIQCHFGAEDHAIPLDQVEQLQDALADKANAEVFVYAGAGHGFNCDQRPSYHPDAAALAWQRTLALFNARL